MEVLNAVDLFGWRFAAAPDPEQRLGKVLGLLDRLADDAAQAAADLRTAIGNMRQHRENARQQSEDPDLLAECREECRAGLAGVWPSGRAAALRACTALQHAADLAECLADSLPLRCTATGASGDVARLADLGRIAGPS